MHKSLNAWPAGVVISGYRIPYLRCADGITLIAKDERELLDMLIRTETVSEKFGLAQICPRQR